MKWNLLYFDDQTQNIECMMELLSDQFRVFGTSDVLSYPELLENHSPHAVLLDVHMPVLDGHSLCKKIIDHPSYSGCPILLISGDQSDENKLSSHTSGAIDLLPRNLSEEELVLRISNKIKYHLSSAKELRLGNLKVDFEGMKAILAGKDVDLTLLEMKMLGILFRNYPKAINRAELIKRIWGEEAVKPGTINTHITNLKQKLQGWSYYITIREENILIFLEEFKLT